MSSHLARSELRERYQGYPAYGAVHDVVPNDQLRGFMYDFSRMADGVFADDFGTVEVNPAAGYVPEEGFLADPIQITPTGSEVAVDEIQVLRLAQTEDNEPQLKPSVIATAGYDPRKYYRIFDPESLGVSVVEMDPSKRAAQTVKAIWEKQDLGAVENEARNEMGRRLPNTAPRLFFNRVEGVGGRLANAPRSDVQQKLALMPDTNRFMETFSLIDEEAEIVISAIQKRLKQFTYPWDIMPHLTFAVFRSGAQVDQIVDVKEAANQYLAVNPFGVRLGDLSFRHKLKRK